MTNAEREALARESLDRTLADTITIIDTCSCLSEHFPEFIKNATPCLIRHRTKLYIPYKCVQELIKHSSSRTDEKLAEKAHHALTLIYTLNSQGHFEVRGKDSDSFADSSILQNLLRHKERYDLTLITQDVNLSKDALKLNSTGSVNSHGHSIAVKKLNRYGFLTTFKENPTDSYTPTPFTVSASLYSGSCDCDTVTETYDKGSVLYTKRGAETVTLKLGDFIADGGEGTVYDVTVGDGTGLPAVIKIFKPGEVGDKKPFYSRKKVELLINSGVRNPAICFPEAIAYNNAGKKVGYIMPKAKGVTLHRLLLSKQSINKAFPGATKKEMVQLCISIINAVKYLHDRNIIIGDLQWDNILVESPTKITVIDTDSFQLNEFPCPVGKVVFTPPERQNMAYGSYLRTFSDDLFALATLLFIIMIPGKFPYDMRGGEDVQGNILAGDFSYPYGDKTNGLVPMGNWRFCWSHLPRELKAAFYGTFRRDADHYLPEKRIPAKEWLAIFKNYLNRIDNGEIGKIDTMSLDLFPVRLKHQKGVEYVRCKDCGIEYSKDIIERGHGYCPRCLLNGDEYECAECGTPMVHTRKEQLEGRPKHPTCPNCFEKNKAPYEYRICPNDNRQFCITIGEQKFLTSKGLPLYKFCSDCRRNAKSAHYDNGGYSGIFPKTTVPRPDNYNGRAKPTPPPAAPDVRPTPPDTEKLSFAERLKKFFGF